MENYFEETREQNQVILLGLSDDATKDVSVEAGNVLKGYDIFKSAKENTYKLSRNKKPLLTQVAQFLRIDCDDMIKEVMVTAIIDKIAALLLEPCRICKTYYNVGRCDVPTLTCFFCGQGCHDACYAQNDDNSVPMAGMFFTCISCEQSRGQKSKLYSGYPSVTPTDAVSSTENDACNENENSKKKIICRFFRNGRCKHGADGMSNGECKYDHPDVCEAYVNYGKFSTHGCGKKQCDKVHPKICYEGVNNGACYNKRCKYFHGSQIKRKREFTNSNSRAFVNHSPHPQPTRNNSFMDESSANTFLEAFLAMKEDMIGRMTGIEQRLTNLEPTPSQAFHNMTQSQAVRIPSDFPMQMQPHAHFPAPWQNQQSNMV